VFLLFPWDNRHAVMISLAPNYNRPFEAHDLPSLIKISPIGALIPKRCASLTVQAVLYQVTASTMRSAMMTAMRVLNDTVEIGNSQLI
jgi:hypothetical protein